MLRDRLFKSMLALFVAVAALGLGVAALSASPQTALADPGDPVVCANTGNTGYWFDLGKGYSTTAATEARAKTDTTPLFVWPTQKTFDMCYIYAEGWNTDWSMWVDYTVNTFGIVDRAGSDAWLSLKSNIYEYKCRSARMTAWQCSQPGNMSGYWSPDSTRTYTICNNGFY